MVPNNHDVRASVAVNQLGKPFAIGAAGDVVHAVADLKLFPKCGAAQRHVDAHGTFEYGFILLDEWPEGSTLVIVVYYIARVRTGTVVIGRPPDFVRPGVGRG